MSLLIDYLEESTSYLRERKELLKKYDDQFRKNFDSDLKREMILIRKDIAKKSSEITNELMYNLEEFRAIHKYFPELLQVYAEDEYIGKIIGKKSWLLDYHSLPAVDAAAKLNQLKEWRYQLKDAKKFLKGWVGTVNAKSFAATYPILKGHISGELDKIEMLESIKKVDKILLREGWLILISDSLIKIPISKFMTKINQLNYEVLKAQSELLRAHGRGTVAETTALRKLQAIQKRKLHYERVLTQVLLANPEYLKSIKKKKDWLSRDKAGNFDKLVNDITPHTIKERMWLNEMKKRVSGDEAEERTAPTENLEAENKTPIQKTPKDLSQIQEKPKPKKESGQKIRKQRQKKN